MHVFTAVPYTARKDGGRGEESWCECVCGPGSEPLQAKRGRGRETIQEDRRPSQKRTDDENRWDGQDKPRTKRKHIHKIYIYVCTYHTYITKTRTRHKHHTGTKKKRTLSENIPRRPFTISGSGCILPSFSCFFSRARSFANL